MWIIFFHMQESGLSTEENIRGVKSSMGFHTSKKTYNLIGWTQDQLYHLQGPGLKKKCRTPCSKIIKKFRTPTANHKTKHGDLLSVSGPLWSYKLHTPTKPALNETNRNTYWAFLCERCNVLRYLLQMISLNPHNDFVGRLLLFTVYWKNKKAQRS